MKDIKTNFAVLAHSVCHLNTLKLCDEGELCVLNSSSDHFLGKYVSGNETMSHQEKMSS
jgi:hypothetical protein